MRIFRREKPVAAAKTLPTGCFSVDSEGKVLASTLPHSFPTGNIAKIAEVVLGIFRNAPNHGMPLSEIVLRYEGLTITARELRGGAIVFLTPLESLLK